MSQPKQFTVTTEPIHTGGMRRFRNAVVLNRNNRLELADIASVVLDAQILHEQADVCWVFFWDDESHVGKQVARTVVFWRRDTVDPLRAPKPAAGFLSTTSTPYRDGLMITAVNRE